MARIKHGTLVANEVTSVDVGQISDSIEVVVVADPAAIYFRVDGVDPVIGGDDTEVVTAGLGASLIVGSPKTIDIRLLSAGTPTYCVRAL